MIRETLHSNIGGPSGRITRIFANVSFPLFADCLYPIRYWVIRYVIIIVIDTLIVAVLALDTRSEEAFWKDFVFSQVIGLLMLSLIDIPHHVLWGDDLSNKKMPPWIVMGVMLIGMPLGQRIARTVLRLNNPNAEPWRANSLCISFTIATFVALGATYYY